MSHTDVYEVKITDQGRLVVPQKLRRELGLGGDTPCIMYRDGDRVILERKGEARTRLATFAELLPSSSSFVTERRREVRFEEHQP